MVGYRRGLTRNYNGKQPQPPPRLLNSHLAMTKVMTVPITYGTKSEEEKDMMMLSAKCTLDTNSSSAL